MWFWYMDVAPFSFCLPPSFARCFLISVCFRGGLLFFVFLQRVHFCLWLGANGNTTVFNILQSGINTAICTSRHHHPGPASPSFDLLPVYESCVSQGWMTYILASLGVLENPRPLVSAYPCFAKVIMLRLSHSVSHTQAIWSFMTHYEKRLCRH